MVLPGFTQPDPRRLVRTLPASSTPPRFAAAMKSEHHPNILSSVFRDCLRGSCGIPPPAGLDIAAHRILYFHP
jgi:hypothetical protein